MSDGLSDKQRTMMQVLIEVCQREGAETFTFISEWLGYAPFGLYCWVDVGSRTNVDEAFPAPWDSADLDALEAGGYIERVSHIAEGSQELDTTTRYRITSKGCGLA